jgi:hypothetical protein
VTYGDASATRLQGQSPEYQTWRGMIERCGNVNQPNYRLYGGRGITVCRRWRNFKYFLEDMGLRPKGLQLDRIDNEGNYCPENCHWVTRTQNLSNTRTNVFLSFNGHTATISEWSRITGIPNRTISGRRASGWDDKRTLTTPSPSAPFPSLIFETQGV